MNPLGNGNIGGLPPQFRQNIQQIKQMMGTIKDPNTLIRQNPMLNQVMQAYSGQDPRQIFMLLCQKNGINPDAILNELRS